MTELKTSGTERWIIVVLCAVAAIRVFVYAAAFPFFSNTDESAKLDLIVKYSHFKIPRSLDPVHPESALYLSIFSSPEYRSAPSESELEPPPWKEPPEKVSEEIKDKQIWWRQHLNYEAMEPPLYYTLAGLWLRAGRACGIEGGLALYWLRFLNVALAVALVCIAFASTKTIFPDRLFFRIGIPFLAAIWPQDAFYIIQSDVLSPICFGFAILALTQLWRSEMSSAPSAIFAGLGLAATFLVKVSNLALVLVSLSAVAIGTWPLSRKKTVRQFLPVIGLFFAAAGVPIVLWCVRNYWISGDLTASAAKIHYLGWTLKPVNEWWSHPIFGLAGSWTFWSELLAGFWRGELVWRQQKLSFAAIDIFYFISSAVFVGSAVIAACQRRRVLNRFQRQYILFAFFSLAASVLLLWILSIIFDFGASLYPSRSYPFFASGRLLSGLAIPIMTLYVFGLDYLLQGFRNCWIRYFVLFAIGLLMTVSEVVLSRPVFSSPYNFFHM